MLMVLFACESADGICGLKWLCQLVGHPGSCMCLGETRCSKPRIIFTSFIEDSTPVQVLPMTFGAVHGPYSDVPKLSIVWSLQPCNDSELIVSRRH